MASLKIVRTRKMLSQVALAKLAGVASSTVYLIERHDPSYFPRLSVMRKLCAALDVEPQDVDEFRAALDAAEKAATEG